MPPFENQLLSGLYDLSLEDDNDGAAVPSPVPLTGVRVEAQILDFIAEVSISQFYYNDSEKTIEAIYHFPADDAAVVCGFAAEYENGAVVKGVVKEKETARKEYKDAKRQGRQANLLESVRRDVFTLSVGNLAPGAYVKIKITYVTTLEARDESAAFVLPTSIFPRYTPPSSPVSSQDAQAMAPSESTVRFFGLDIRVETACHSPIVSLDSPTHASDLSVVQKTPRNWEFSMNDIAMDRDVVVLIKEVDSHQPRAAVEISGDDTMTGLVTFFPEIELPDEQREFVFVVDRSASMDGQRITQARDALLLFLRSLSEGCTFDIIGFGSHYKSLFDGPVPYNDDNLEEASRYAATLTADFGGTEILSPLREIFARATPDGVERQVFMLTDGQVSNDKQVFNLIGTHCQTENRSNRLFSVGIGRGVSRHLVSGMARAGRGTHRFVEDSSEDSLHVKVLGQLKQSQQPALENVSLEWRFPDEEALGPCVVKAPIKTLLGDRSPSLDTVAARTLQPTMYPSLFPPIFNKERYIIYSMFAAGSAKPTSVTVKCVTTDGPLSISLPISDEDHFRGSVARKLAARIAISEYEDASKYSGSTAKFTSKDDAMHLAIRNSLASSQTSFLAVSEKKSVDRGTLSETIVIPQLRHLDGHAQDWGCNEEMCRMRSRKERKRSFGMQVDGGAKRMAPTQSRASACSLGADFIDRTTLHRANSPIHFSDKEDDAISTICFAPLATPPRPNSAIYFSDKEDDANSTICFAPLATPPRANSPIYFADEEDDACEVFNSALSGPSRAYQPKDALTQLCMLQKANGSFVLSESFEIAANLTKSSIDMLRGLVVGTPNDTIFATAVAISVLRVKFPKKRNIWELQENKALLFLQKSGEVLDEAISNMEKEIKCMAKVSA